MAWINSHGLLLLVVSWAIALVISTAPPLPTGSGFWKTWVYNAMQVFGASLDKVVHNSPIAQAIEVQQKDVHTQTLTVNADPKL